MKKIRVIIADDHHLIIDGIRSLLEEADDIAIVGEASNGRELIELLFLVSADVILLDVEMPVMNGIEAARNIKTNHRDVRIIILTMHQERGLIQQLIDLGADGYLLKNSDRTELIQAIRRVASGVPYFSHQVTLALLNKTAPMSRSSEDGHLLSLLTPREIEIMKLIAEGHSNRQIGESLFISHRTVDTHRTNLMKKIGAANIAALIRFAVRNGFIE
ncbi:MAG: response regulator transcription factor [Bacteroidales bacterium]|nr:response regulator transcription factor [Bacteroidales bacterium]